MDTLVNQPAEIEKTDRRALLIVNPVSGRRTIVRYVLPIIRRLMDEGYLVTTMVTGARGDATAFARN